MRSRSSSPGLPPIWLPAAILTVALAALAGVADAGVSVEGSLLGLLVGFAGAAWILLSLLRPLSAFSLLLFVYVTAHARTTVSVLAGAALLGEAQSGPGLTDLLWAGLVVGFAIRVLLGRESLRRPGAFPWPLWAMLPFCALAVLLPLLGVLASDWPLGYASPGLRQLQWLSLAAFGYVLVERQGIGPVVRAVVGVMLAAGLLHAIYGLVQMGHFLGHLGDPWLLLDRWFAARSARSWFYYPRLTGLLTNPNSYGLFGALLAVVGFASLAASRWRSGLLAMAAAAFALVFSGSRSALLGLGAAFALAAGMAVVRRRASARALKIAGGTVGLAALSAIALWPLVPESLRARFERVFLVFVVGLEAESNAVARLQFWKEAFARTAADHPLGTWVPPSYALDNPIDSYYVFTALQGTPGYTALWLLFLTGAVALGYRLLGRSAPGGQSHARVAAFMLMGFAAVIAGGSLTLSPILQPQILAPFWTVLGICAAGSLNVRGNVLHGTDIGGGRDQ